MEHVRVNEWISNVTDSLYLLQCKNILCDATIECAGGEMIHAHACVLAAASPILHNAILLNSTSNKPCMQDILGDRMTKESAHESSHSSCRLITGYPFSDEIWNVLIQFLYLGVLNVDTQKTDITALEDAAEQLCITALKEKITQIKVAEDVTENNIAEIADGVSCQAVYIVSSQNEDIITNQVEDIITNQIEDIITNQDLDIVTNQGEDIVTNEGEDIITNQVEDIITNQDPDIITNQDADIITKQDPDIITNQGEGVIINQGRDVARNQDEFESDVEIPLVQSETRVPCHLKQKQSLTKSKPTNCSLCNITCELGTKLEQHLRKYHPEMKCKQCEKYFDSKRKLLMHEKMMHESDGDTFACQLCDHVAKSKAHLFIHQRLHKQHNCTHCSFQAKSRSALLLHLQKDHASRKLFKCGVAYCSYATNIHGSLKLHQSTVHESQRNFQCSYCGKSYKTQITLDKHMAVHKHAFRCDICQASFARKFSLDDHKRKNHEAEPLRCSLCDAPFISLAKLSKHIREVHKGLKTKYKRFPCKLCGKVQKSMSELRRHMRIHTGEKLFPCDQCRRAFATKHDLNNHKMTHTGEKPFLCSYCSFRCNRQYNLNVHEKKHKEWIAANKTAIICSLCQPNVTFKCLNDLESHNFRLHPISPLQEILESETKNIELEPTDNNASQHYEIVVISGHDAGTTEQQIIVPVNEEAISDGHSVAANTLISNHNVDKDTSGNIIVSDKSQIALLEKSYPIKTFTSAPNQVTTLLQTSIPVNHTELSSTPLQTQPLTSYNVSSQQTVEDGITLPDGTQVLDFDNLIDTSQINEDLIPMEKEMYDNSPIMLQGTDGSIQEYIVCHTDAGEKYLVQSNAVIMSEEENPATLSPSESNMSTLITQQPD